MYSLSFPNIFTGGKTNLLENREAAISNLKLTLLSTKTELFGDPDFGANLKKFLYDQNNYVLRDLIIEEIYTTIQVFAPQIRTERKNIEIVSENDKLYANVKYVYIKDKILDMFTIKLTEE